MWLPNLADESWLADVVTAHARTLGVAGPVDAVRLLDARLTHPHRPESPLCRGWATCVVTPRVGAPAELYVKGFPDGDTSEEAWRRDRAMLAESSSGTSRVCDPIERELLVALLAIRAFPVKRAPLARRGRPRRTRRCRPSAGGWPP